MNFAIVGCKSFALVTASAMCTVTLSASSVKIVLELSMVALLFSITRMAISSFMVRYVHLLWEVVPERPPPGALLRCGVRTWIRSLISVFVNELSCQLHRPILVSSGADRGPCGC